MKLKLKTMWLYFGLLALSGICLSRMLSETCWFDEYGNMTCQADPQPDTCGQPGAPVCE